MVSLGIKDLNDVLTVSRIALECKRVDELRNEVLSLLKKNFNCEKANFFLTHSSGQLILDRVVKQGIEDKAIGQYHDYYWYLDPFPPKLVIPTPIILTTEQITNLSDFVRTEYYNDFLVPQSIHHQMTIFLSAENQALGVIAVFRPQHEANFSQRERKKAELTAPYLASALQKTIVLESNNPVRIISHNLKKFGISQRELDVICLLYQGLENSEIADKLYISRYTVENHLKSIYKKLYAKNRTSLICKLYHLT
jgi:DNA-binding CsgD family transcriptional regulator